MKRQPGLEGHPYRALLVEYDRENPDPCFTPDLIRYIEFRQPGLTSRDLAKLDEIEWFTCHRHFKDLSEFAIPGLRASRHTEVRYVKRYNAQAYLTMINEFFAYTLPDFSNHRAGGCILPGYRLTCPDGSQFYPVEYNGDLPAWRKRLTDSAVHFGTSIGYFDHGRFVISDGREIEFADMGVASDDDQRLPPDF